MKTLHFGVDQAYQNTGLAILEHDSETHDLKFIKSWNFHPTIKLNEKSEAIGLLEHLKNMYELFAIEGDCSGMSSCAMEDRAFSSFGQAGTRGAVWAVYSTFLVRQADLIIVSPLKLKYFATGSGKAEKPEIIKYAKDRFGIQDKKITADEADALVLAEIGVYAYLCIKNGEQALQSLPDHKKEILISEKKASGGMQGICKRIDDFYISRRT